MILRRTLNYRTIQLAGHTRDEVVGLVRRDGTIGYRLWCGFIDAQEARQLAAAVPVKMVIAAFALTDEPGARWSAMPADRFLQGCLAVEGVRCVLVGGMPRLVSSRLLIQS